MIVQCDFVKVTEGGEITQAGNYDSLLADGHAFKQLVNAHEDAMGTVHNQDDSEEHDDSAEVKLGKATSLSEKMLKSLSKARSRHGSRREQDPPVQVPLTQLTQQEERETGDQGWGIYLEYIRIAKGWLVFYLGIASQSVFVLGQMAANYWMATRVTDQGTSDALLIGVYSGLSIISGIFVFLRSRFNVMLGLRASSSFFGQLIFCLFRAPMAFFDSTPMGRILSRVCD